jgi:hypothetical protein
MARCWHIYIEFEITRQTVVQFVVGGVLAEVRILELEYVIFVEELEVELAAIRDGRVVRIEGQLSQKRRGEPSVHRRNGTKRGAPGIGGDTT